MQIKSEGVGFRYPGSPADCCALKEVSLAAEAGEFVCLLGKTGSGKSTLLRTLAGFAKPSEGRVLLDGASVYEKKFDRSQLRKKIGLLFQYPEKQLFEETAARDVVFGLKKLHLTGSETEKRTAEAMEAVGLSYGCLGEESPWALSGGQKRLLALAGVIAPKPELLLLDEPLAGLDAAAREQVLAVLHRLVRDGTGILMVTHDADAAAETADRIVLMESGRIAAAGLPEEIFSDFELLETCGLGSCRAAELSRILKEDFDLPDGIVRYEELLHALVTLCKGGEGG